MDEEWNEHDEWIEGYAARVMQHEFDHLEGLMYVDHISALRKNLIGGKLKNIMKGKFKCAYRTKIYRK
jgi:peptide deformylase